MSPGNYMEKKKKRQELTKVWAMETLSLLAHHRGCREGSRLVTAGTTDYRVAWVRKCRRDKCFLVRDQMPRIQRKELIRVWCHHLACGLAREQDYETKPKANLPRSIFSRGNKENSTNSKSSWVCILNIIHISQTTKFSEKKTWISFWLQVLRSCILIQWKSLGLCRPHTSLFSASVAPGLGLYRLWDLYRPISLRILKYVAKAPPPIAFN